MWRIHIIFLLLLSSSALAQTVKNSTFLPNPTGPYEVGTFNWYPEDTIREEPFTSNTADHRRLFVKVWYPAATCSSAEVTYYMKGYDCKTMMRNFIWINATKEYFRLLNAIPTNSKLEVPAAETENKFPIVIFSPGYGFGQVEFYHSILENLASHGYVVCAINHPYECALINYSDGTSTKNKNFINLIRFNSELQRYKRMTKRCISNDERSDVIRYVEKNSRFILKSHALWVNDTRFVMDKLTCLEEVSDCILKGKIDLNKIGALGHSFGGSVTGQTCAEDERIKAGINLDGWQYGNVFENGVKCPLLVISAEVNDWYDHFYFKSENLIFSTTLLQAKHFTFTDLSVLPDIPEKQKIKYLSTTNTLFNLQLTNDLIVKFFNSTLRGKDNLTDFAINCQKCKVIGGMKIGLNTNK